MDMKRSLCILAVAAVGLCASGARIAAAQVVSTFDDPAIPVVLGPNSNFFPGATTTFMSGLGTFNHNFTDFGGGCCWDGWTYSNRTGNVQPGVQNQFSAFPGGDADGPANGGNYGLAFIFGVPAITFATPSIVAGGYFANTTYAALSMLMGDGFAKKFGGASGNDPDFFALTITGKDGGGATTGAVDFHLADYRFADNSQDYIVANWRFVDLSSLGPVSRLEFALASSDNGTFGINTPGYFALDNLSVTAIPEPSAALLLLAGLAATIAIAQRRRRRA
jgi:hypothetical protein